MELRCPDCASPELAPIDRRAPLGCANGGSTFTRTDAFVTVDDADAHSEEAACCTCDEVRGCSQCFERAESLVGALVRDYLGRGWRVWDVGEKDGFPTLAGQCFWDRPDQVDVLRPSGEAADSLADSNCPGEP